MKPFLIFALAICSLSAFASDEYNCNMFPGEQGGHALLIRVEGNRAKVFTVYPSEQESVPQYTATLHQVSGRNSRIMHFIDNANKDRFEFFIRRGAGTVGVAGNSTNSFSLYSCEKIREMVACPPDDSETIVKICE